MIVNIILRKNRKECDIITVIPKGCRGYNRIIVFKEEYNRCDIITAVRLVIVKGSTEMETGHHELCSLPVNTLR